MPSITPAEIVVVSTAVLILYVVPFLLASIDKRQRHRLPVWSATVTVTEPPDQVATATPTVDVPSARAAETAQCRDAEAASPEEPASTAREDGARAPVVEAPELAAPIAATECAPDTSEPTADATPAGNGPESPAFEPFAGDAGYQFRLEDLRRVRFPDWPDAAGGHLWRDAERVADAHRADVFGSVLLSPYPIRSACRGGVEQEHSTLRLSYLLFPSLWPASRDQAVAQARFEIDMESGTVRHCLEALRRTELSADTRRAIRDNGGDI